MPVPARRRLLRTHKQPPPTPDVPATVEAGVIATREAETAIDATVEAKVAAALTAPTPTTAPMPTATPRPTNTPYPTAAPLTVCAVDSQEWRLRVILTEFNIFASWRATTSNSGISIPSGCMSLNYTSHHGSKGLRAGLVAPVPGRGRLNYTPPDGSDIPLSMGHAGTPSVLG